jgi:hypothetical protein
VRKALAPIAKWRKVTPAVLMEIGGKRNRLHE